MGIHERLSSLFSSRLSSEADLSFFPPLPFRFPFPLSSTDPSTVHNSTLPAQIYHFPSEKPPSDSALVKEARELGAEMVEAVGTTKDLTRGKNYHLKAIAIVQCPWREVLYLVSPWLANARRKRREERRFPFPNA